VITFCKLHTAVEPLHDGLSVCQHAAWLIVSKEKIPALGRL